MRVVNDLSLLTAAVVRYIFLLVGFYIALIPGSDVLAYILVSGRQFLFLIFFYYLSYFFFTLWPPNPDRTRATESLPRIRLQTGMCLHIVLDSDPASSSPLLGVLQPGAKELALHQHSRLVLLASLSSSSSSLLLQLLQ